MSAARRRSTVARSRRSATGRKPTPSRSPRQSEPQPRNDAERRAARWYRLRGWRVVATNVWIAGNELDVVAARGRLLVFCEVKSKSSARFGDPLEMIDAEKVRRIRRAAEAWLAARPEYAEHVVRFDVIVERAGRLEHLPNAF